MSLENYITGMNSASGGMWENKQTSKLYRPFIWLSYVYNIRLLRSWQTWRSLT